MSKKQKKKLGKLGKILLSIAGALILSLASLPFVVGRFLSAEYLEEVIENELRCEAEITSIKRRIFALGGSGRIELKELTIQLKEDAIIELLQNSELEDQELELARKILEEPVILAESAELRFRRLPLFQGRFEVESLSIERPQFFVHQIKGLGSNLQGLEEPKEDAEAEPKPEAEAAQKDPAPKAEQELAMKKQAEAKEGTKQSVQLGLEKITLANGVIQYTTTDPSKQESEDKAISAVLRDIQLSVSDFSQDESTTTETTLKLSGLLGIDKGGAEQRLAQLNLDGEGKLNWPAQTKRNLDNAKWQFKLTASEDSFVYAQEVIDSLREDVENFLNQTRMSDLDFIKTGLDVSPQGKFLGERNIILEGKGKRITLNNEPKIGFDDVQVGIQAGSWISFGKDGEHELITQFSPPPKVASQAYTEIPKKLESYYLGKQWPKLKDAYFREEKLHLNFASRGPNKDFDLEISPDPDDIFVIEEVIEDTLGDLLKKLLEAAED